MSNDKEELFLQNLKNKYLIDIKEIVSIIEEINLNRDIKEIYQQKINEMGIIYLFSYLEAFNHDYFVKLFQYNPYQILAKKVANEKDQKKLVMNFDDIITKDYGETLEENWLLENMAEKMYSEVFDYSRMNWKSFVKKLLDDFLELDFSRECQNRNIILDDFQKFRDYRNSIVHKLSVNNNKKGKMNVFNLKELITNYIKILDESITKKYFQKMTSPKTLFFDE